jgi:hypothetical protein
MPSPTSLGSRLTREGRFKAGLGAALLVLFCVPYFTLQHVALGEPRRFALSALDRAIEFDPRWVWAYQSVYLYICLVPWLSTSRADLRRYARGFVLLAAVGFVCFFVYPVDGPRPDAVPHTGVFGLLVSYDGTRNAMPSLHVGLAAYTLFFGVRTIGSELTTASRRLWTAIGAAWLAAIAYATLATRQHYAIDLPPGLLGAWLAHRWVWAPVGRATPP